MPRTPERRTPHRTGSAWAHQLHSSFWSIKLAGCPRLTVFLAFLLVCALTGGVARWDALPLVVIRSAAIVTIGILVILPGPWDWRGLRVPAILLGMFAISIAIQLIPLPPTLWPSLPGRASYIAAATIAGIDQPWRPISLIPYRTANSLLATLPAFAGLVALGGIPRTRWLALADALVLLCCVSALLGVLQFGTGTFYPYSPSDVGLPIGLMANRNHQALLLAIGVLLLGHWGLRRDRKGREIPVRAITAVAMILLLVTVILLTGSRAGLGLMLAAVIANVITAVLRMLGERNRSPLRLLLIGAPVVMIGIGAYIARMSSVVRLSNSIDNIGEDMRLLALPTVWKMVEHYFPFGAGFGTFDQLFMQFEPDDLLKRTFFNRAHSDPLEVMITGGLPSLLVVCAFLIWLVLRARCLFFVGLNTRRRNIAFQLARTAFLAIVLALLASLIDYPLRTPLLSLVFVLLCGFSCQNSTVSDHIANDHMSDTANRSTGEIHRS